MTQPEVSAEQGVIIVTGAAQGIGEAVARHLAAEGYRLILADIQAGLVSEVAASLGATGIGVDIAEPLSVEAMVAEALRAGPWVAGLVNVAGIDAPDATWDEVDAAHWRRLIDVDLSGQWWCMRSVLPHMIANRAGRIITISSVCGVVPCAGVSVAYGAAKAGVVGLTMALAKEVEKHGVLVNAIAPGATGNTGTSMSEDRRQRFADQFPLGPIGTAPVARAVSYLLGEGGSYVSGTVLNVSGGYWHGR